MNEIVSYGMTIMIYYVMNDLSTQLDIIHRYLCNKWLLHNPINPETLNWKKKWNWRISETVIPYFCHVQKQ